MDVEDEPNSYLKYLNDSDAPNTYLLENNEVGLFSVEPIFTEMEATDWPQEGFPLLLTSSLITDDSTEDQDTSSQSSDRNVVDRVTKPIEESLHGDSMDSKNLEVQNIIEIQPTRNEVELDEEDLELAKNSLLLNQKQIQLKCGVKDCLEARDNCIQRDETNIQLQNNDLQLSGNKVGIAETNTPNEKYLLVTRNVNDERGIFPNSKSVLKSGVKKSEVFSQKKSKNVNDLFSTVIANKCKICSFLCEDLEQIKRHIGEKHPEFIFTHNGILNGVSLLLSNIKQGGEQGSEVRKEYTLFVCSECHSVCVDKNDLMKHMIKKHNLTREEAESSPPSTPEPEDNTEKMKPIYKKTTVLSDVNVSEIKRQEKANQKVKCTVQGCNAGFPTDELRIVHAKLHIGETKNLFNCLECDQTFHIWRVARIHMHKDHGIDFGMIVCPMCNIYKSYKTVNMLRHMVIHKDLKPFLCDDCGEVFKQLSQLKNHQVVHKTPEDLPTWCRLKKCDKCQRIFANSKSLKAHIQAVHENFKPFICNICGHKSARKAMLELHLRQHTGKKPHKCNDCDYKTGDPNCLRKHMMKHLGAVTYQCPHCPYRCIQSGSIKTHLLNKHKGQNGTFTCKHCSYTTVNAAQIYFHEKKHEIASMEGANTEKNSANNDTERRTETDLQTDEETQSCFLHTESQMEETVDKGGITIPAGLEIENVT